MASAMYPSCKALLLTAGIDLESDVTIKCVLLTATYTYSAAHTFYTSMTGPVGTPQALTAKTINVPAAGTFDAADATFPAVTAGSTVNAIGLFKDTGVAGTSDLVCYIDGVSVVSNGGSIGVTWSASGIFSI